MLHERWGCTEESRSHRRLGRAITGRVSPWPRRALLIALVLAAVGLLAGCAATDRLRCQMIPEPTWFRIEGAKPLPMTVIEVPHRGILKACQYASECGCAMRLESDGVCLVYVVVNAPESTRAHELRHCEGWGHP